MSNEAHKSPAAQARARAVLKRYLPLWIVLAGVLAVVALAVALPARSWEAPPTEPPPVNVQLREIRPVEALDETFTLHGVVEPSRIVRVAAQVSGQIERVGYRTSPVVWQRRTLEAGQPVVEGEPITAGDVIVVLDTDLLQAEYDRAKAQSDFDAREYSRIADLFARNVATKTEVDQIRTRMEVSRAALATAAVQLDRSTILAPITGILNELPAEVGEYVQPGMLVGQIVDMRTAKVVVDVPERDLHYLHAGDAAEVLIDSLGGRSVEGRITFISELAAPQTRTTPVEIHVENDKRLLRSGQIVTVRLKRRTLHDVIMVPLEVVIPLESGRVVYVAEDGLAQRREVKLGFMRGTEVQILDGLAAGDHLIVSGQRFIGPGQKLRVVEAPADQARQEDEPAGRRGD